MKIWSAGARFLQGQISRIDIGFVELGHELTEHSHEADLIFSNDPAAFNQIIVDKCSGKLRGRVIFNVLDVPIHLGKSFDYDLLRNQLLHADAITSISEYVRWQVKEYLGLDSHIIYNPIKAVEKRSVTVFPRKKFAHVGRRFDFNKRTSLGVYALQILGYTQDDLYLAGNEGGWGDYLGVLSDSDLNRVYNSVDFVLCTSKIEGLCLPVCESMAAGVIPIVCQDMTTRRELLPPDLFPEFSAIDPTVESIAKFIVKMTNDPEGMAAMKERLYTHFQKEWAYKLSGRGVAEAILGVAAGIDKSVS